MKKALILLSVTAVAFGLVACQGGGDTAPASQTPDSGATGGLAVEKRAAAPLRSVDISCGTGQNQIIVSSTTPNVPDFPQGSFDTLEGLQCDFDVFSWNSFIALSHAPDGSFATGKPTVWESWPDSSDIFLAGGADPGAWPGGRDQPASCKGRGDFPVLSQIGKRPDILEAADEPFISGPLIDTRGWYSRFSISVNRDMYDYIRAHTLYSRAGQSAFSKAGHAVSFPCGCNPDPSDKSCSQDGQIGAVMVKAAWMVLDGRDDASSFHTADALVITPAVGDQPETCEKRTMGLVGFHIGHKTQNSPQWLWSTFEHVKNVPTMGESIPEGATFNYYLTDCEDCNEVNQPPPQPWNPHDQPVTENSRKSQVMRVLPIDGATRAMNAKAQELLKGTVWANYELVSTQWPTNASGTAGTAPSAPLWCGELNPADKAGAPAPPFLGNSTLETYIQGTVPQASSSCINCHLNATMAEGQSSFSDFTYLLERAQ